MADEPLLAAAGAASDGRPPGWTEAHALMFIADYGTPSVEAFADAFVLGNWIAIRLHWPEFDEFVRRRS